MPSNVSSNSLDYSLKEFTRDFEENDGEETARVIYREAVCESGSSESLHARLRT